MQTFPVVYSSLSATGLLQLIRDAYNLDTDYQILFLKRGFNDTYLISGRQERFILRVYNYQWRQLNDIEAELDLLLYLKKNGVFVSTPIQDVKNGYIQPIAAPEGARYAVLFSYAEGEQIKKLSVDQSLLLGVTTGCMHQLTKDKILPATARDYDIEKQLGHSLQILKPILKDHPAQFDFFIALRESFLKMVASVPEDEITTGICHGDLQAENFHISADHHFTFFDFDFFGKGYLIYDIGVFMWYDHKNKPPAIMNAFLKGYESRRPLSDTEKRLIPWMSTLRAIFQMTMYCELSDGKQLPLWPPQQVADFINKVEKWQKQRCG